MKNSEKGSNAIALGMGIVELKKHHEKVCAEADSAEKILLQILPKSFLQQTEAWRRLRPLLRLSSHVLEELEGRLSSIDSGFKT